MGHVFATAQPCAHVRFRRAVDVAYHGLVEKGESRYELYRVRRARGEPACLANELHAITRKDATPQHPSLRGMVSPTSSPTTPAGSRTVAPTTSTT